jgi:hypothetical protein
MAWTRQPVRKERPSERSQMTQSPSRIPKPADLIGSIPQSTCICHRVGALLPGACVLVRQGPAANNFRYGESRGGSIFSINVTAGNQAIGIRGRSDSYVDAIGLNYATINRSPRRADRR